MVAPLVPREWVEPTITGTTPLHVRGRTFFVPVGASVRFATRVAVIVTDDGTVHVLGEHGELVTTDAEKQALPHAHEASRERVTGTNLYRERHPLSDESR